MIRYLIGGGGGGGSIQNQMPKLTYSQYQLAYLYVLLLWFNYEGEWK